MNDQSKRVVTLPEDPQDIIRRLSTVNDEFTLVSRLYPRIAESARRELAPGGIVNMFLLAVYDYMQEGYPPTIRARLYMSIPHWIDALIDDREVAEAAKQWLEQVKGP